MAKKKFSSKVNSFLYNHIWLKYTVEYSWAILLTLVSAFIFTIGINTFMAPSVNNLIPIVSGGVSGCSQIVTLIYQIITGESSGTVHSLIYGIAYTLINIPLAIIAFKGIGIRFAIFTVFNFAAVSLFSSFLNTENVQLLADIAIFVNEHGGMLARVLFAGLTTGLSSALAFKIETSTGGVDVISYYLSLRKSTSAGKYGVIVNTFIVVIYALLQGISGVTPDGETSSWVIAISGVLFTIVYLFTSMLVIDFINVRNKKVQLQIITKNEKLPTYLLANIPHGATITHGKGAFSDDERLVIYMVVSSFETKHVVSLIKSLDPDSFVTVTSLQQVYGRFFIKPVK